MPHAHMSHVICHMLVCRMSCMCHVSYVACHMLMPCCVLSLHVVQAPLHTAVVPILVVDTRHPVGSPSVGMPSVVVVVVVVGMRLVASAPVDMVVAVVVVVVAVCVDAHARLPQARLLTQQRERHPCAYGISAHASRSSGHDKRRRHVNASSHGMCMTCWCCRCEHPDLKKRCPNREQHRQTTAAT